MRYRLNLQTRLFKLLPLFSLIVSATSPQAALARETDTGAYGTVGLEVSRFNEELGVLISFSGGYALDGYFLGLKLYDLLNGPTLPESETPPGVELHTKLHFAGLELGWTGGRRGHLRPAASLLVGGGDVSVYEDVKKDAAGQSWFFVLQPTLSLGAPLDWGVLPRLDLSWRYLMGSSTPGTGDAELGGPSLGLSVRFPN